MLTRKQHELLIFIDRHLKSTGFSPSFEEMKEALQLKSKSGIHRLISALEERGFLRRMEKRARALEIIKLPDNVSETLRPATTRSQAQRMSPGHRTRGATARQSSFSTGNLTVIVSLPTVTLGSPARCR